MTARQQRTAIKKKGASAPGLRLGYARVSTADQSLNMQLEALNKADVAAVYEEHASGKSRERPELANLLRALRPGDTLVVWRLDRLGRSLVHLVQILDDLAKRSITIESLTEKIDTSSAAGKLFVGFIVVMAEFERNLISERTIEGLKSARRRGVSGGRPKKLSESRERQMKAMLEDPKATVGDVAKTLGISRTTVYNYLKKSAERASQ
jgi:DNA invertase Pin-like site-specific DNA recombinase